MEDRQFQVYAQTRSTRQLAGDLACELMKTEPKEVWEAWRKVEYVLNDVECDLEQILARRAAK